MYTDLYVKYRLFLSDLKLGVFVTDCRKFLKYQILQHNKPLRVEAEFFPRGKTVKQT